MSPANPSHPKSRRSRVVTPSRLTAEEREIWRTICAGDPTLSGPFFSPVFAEAAERAGVDARVCIIEDDGRIAAFFPFQFANSLSRWLGAGMRIGGEISDHFGMIAPPGFSISERELLRLCGLSSFYFTHLDEAQLRHGLHGERPEIGLLVRMERGGAARWEEICANDKMLAGDTKRKVRRITEKFGPLNFEFQIADPHPALDRLIEIKRRQYARTNSGDSLGDAWKRRMLHDLADSQAPDCEGVLSVLSAGNEYLASHFGIRGRSDMHYWFPVYNIEHEKLSPGRLIYKYLVEAADAHGFKTLDNGAGDTRAKRDFSNASMTYYRGTWQRPGLKSLFTGAGMSARWRAQALLRRASPS
jgi:CelD/BcsL family acetyltransferase involved in cellulose biosynthesis